jgi:electron transport complex protein RnfG
MPRSPLKLIAAVLVACTASALGLGATYAATRERIEEQIRIAEERSLEAAFPDAAEFDEETEEDFIEEAEEVSDDVFAAGYRALDDSGELVGFAVRVEPRGYGGPIQLVVGMDRDGEVTGVSIITMSETPGLGTKIGDEEFLDQFEEWAAEDIEADGKTLDAISGATKSSNGVRKGVLAAGHVYNEVLVDLQGGGE